MPRYGDLDALEKKLFPMGVVDDGRYALPAKAVKVAIDRLPTADVVPMAMIAEIESKIGKDIGDIVESVTSITDPDAIDGQYERISTLEWVLDFVAELKKKYGVD